MKDNKLIQLLKSLNKFEVAGFEKYLESGLVRNTPAGSKLWNILKDHHPAFEIPFDKEQLYKKIEPRRKYDDKQMRYIFYDLNKALEQYIACKAFLDNMNNYSVTLQDELLKRNCGRSLSDELQRHKALLEKETIHDQHYLYYNYRNEFNSLVWETRQLKRTGKESMEKVMDALDRFYLSVKLQLSSEIYNVQNVLSVKYHTFLLDEIIQHLDKHPYEDSPLIAVYFTVYLTLTAENSDAHFDKLTHLLRQYENRLSPHDLRDAYQYVFNYCIRQINKGDPKYMERLFEAYNTTLENKVLLDKGTLSQWDFKNIVTVSLKLKKYEWAVKFIHDHKHLISANERENAYRYNLANVYFNTKQFSKAIGLLQKVEFTDLYYQLDTRAMLLKIYYEMAEAEGFIYHVSAFKMFLRRNKKVSDYQRNIYKNLVSLSSKAFRLRERGKSTAPIRKKAEEIKQIADYNWLMSQLD
jgi:hypothetical protein